MTSWRDTLAKFIADAFKDDTLPDDVLFLWDNIKPDAIACDQPFIAISIKQNAFSVGMGQKITGQISFTIASPASTGTAFCDQILALIQRKICFQTRGFHVLLGHDCGPYQLVGGHFRMMVTVAFLAFHPQSQN